MPPVDMTQTDKRLSAYSISCHIMLITYRKE